MKSILNIAFCFSIISILLGCSKDDDATHNTNEIYFDTYPEIIMEGEGKSLIILKLEKPAKVDGTLTINHNGLDGLLVTNVLAIDDSSIALSIVKGDKETSFTIEKKNDGSISEQTELVFEITTLNLDPDLKIGVKRKINIELSDDELFGFPKKLYIGENGEYSKRYNYTKTGKLKQIIERYSPEITTNNSEITTIENYSYDHLDRLIKIITTDNSGHSVNEQNFTWEEGKITTSVIVYQPSGLSVTRKYTYNLKGIIESFEAKGYNGYTQIDTKTTYTYYSDGNVKKIEELHKVGEEYKFGMSIDFENFMDQSYNFYEHTIIPSVSIVKNVYSKAHFEYSSLFYWWDNDEDEIVAYDEYYIYDFDPMGRLASREIPGTGNKIYFTYY